MKTVYDEKTFSHKIDYSDELSPSAVVLRQVIDAIASDRESKVKNALVKLGWTPPNGMTDAPSGLNPLTNFGEKQIPQSKYTFSRDAAQTEGIDRLEAKLDRILAIVSSITGQPKSLESLYCQCERRNLRRLAGAYCSKCGKVIGQG